MATTADSSSPHHSPASGEVISQFQRKSPWSQVVRGEPESIPTIDISSLPSIPLSSSPSIPSNSEQNYLFSSVPPENSMLPENSVLSPEPAEESYEVTSGNAARQKKPAWNKPSNGVVEIRAVMDAVSWPALSDAAKASPKSLSELSNQISDGSVSVLGPVIPISPQKQATTAANLNSNSVPNHTLPVRQRSMKRGNGGIGVGPVQTGFTHPPPPPPPPFPVFGVPPNAYGKLVPGAPDSSSREAPFRPNNWELRPMGGFGTQLHAMNDPPTQRNSHRRGSFGTHPRGDGQYHNNHGGRRNHDRGNYEWNFSRGSNVRDVQMPPQRAPPRSFVGPPPPGSTPFITPQTVRPFGNPIAFPEITPPVFLYPAPPPESFRGMPFVTHSQAPPPGMFFPVDPHLPAYIVNQIDYYFSDANLVKDEFLKSNMDDQGWVPITLIANFPRVKSLTSNVQLILDSLQASTIVEVKDDKLRRRVDWMKWISSSGRVSIDSGSQSPGMSSYNMLSTGLQKITLGEVGASNQNSTTGKAVLVRSSSEELSGKSNGEGSDY